MIEVLICGAILILSLIFLYRFISTNPTKVTNNSNGDERGPEWKKVTVRIWQSDRNPHKVKTDRIVSKVGHVSIEFNKMYVSLWPKDDEALVFPQNHEMKTLLEDRTEEGPYVSQDEMAEIIRTQGADCIRDVTINGHTYHKHMKDPDAIFHFYTLDIVKMLVKLNQFQCIFKSPTSKNDGVGWCLFGPCLKNHAHNCASAVWLFLEEGGIGKLLSKWSRNKISSRESSYGAFSSSRGLTESNWQQSSDGSLYSSEMVVSQLIKSPDVLFVWLKNAEDSEKKKWQNEH